jgi:peptide/nickel transport system substrate-binding protein
MIGVSAPILAMVSQACTSDDSKPVTVDTTTTPSDENAIGSSHLVVGVRQGDANSGLDPVNMAEAGTYAVVAQSFEHLVGVDATGAIAPGGLARSWSPNRDGSAWTFELRDGPEWSDGSPLTMSDVAATVNRLIVAGNAGFTGLLVEGSVDIVDPTTARFNLNEPNGNFPLLLSASNPQSVITPVDYRNGTTLDERIEGTGPWILEAFDAPSFVAMLRRNPKWWGPRVGVETIELRGFPSSAAAVLSMQSGEIDVVAQYRGADGPSLDAEDHLKVIRTASSAHRQIWFNTKSGIFGDHRVRQAVAWSVERTRAVADIALGSGMIGNDHPVRAGLGSMPFFDPDAVDQRSQDIGRATRLIEEVRSSGLSTVLHTNELPEAMSLAEMVAESIGRLGIATTVESESSETFYRDTWCPTTETERACGGSADFGIIEYEHQALPDVALGRGFVTGGRWNASNYANPDLDRLVGEYRRSIDLDGQRNAIGRIQEILWTDVPAIVPYFDDILTAHTSSVSGVQVLASGQPILSSARKS